MTMPVAIFDSDHESTEDWLDKVGFCLFPIANLAVRFLSTTIQKPTILKSHPPPQTINRLSSIERELVLSLTDWSNPEDFTYVGLFYTNCM